VVDSAVVAGVVTEVAVVEVAVVLVEVAAVDLAVEEDVEHLILTGNWLVLVVH